MTEQSCSLLGCGGTDDRAFALADYASDLPRWCAGCGDHSVLSSVQRLLEAEQLPPERTVFVSGIGCSSRFPHYVHAYGFHGIHGRALPIATGVRLGRPDLHVFVVMGDGDCCSIGAGHWIHALRYNTNMVALLLDNNIYGLTKNQTSPTTPAGHKTNTQPEGSYLPALDPLSAMLGVTNISFVAQTADWIPAHLYATLLAAHHHQGLSFVRILQRCPVFTPLIFQDAVRHPERTEILVHPDGVVAPEIDNLYKKQIEHDPGDLDAARAVANYDMADGIRLGLFYRSETQPRYDDTRLRTARTAAERIDLLNAELDEYAV